MMTVSAKDVAALRARTGAGMGDCKKALEETGGDIEKAIDHLRKKGIAKADKRADRVAAEGQIVTWVADDASLGVMIELNSETDFVSRNEEFVAVATLVARHQCGHGDELFVAGHKVGFGVELNHHAERRIVRHPRHDLPLCGHAIGPLVGLSDALLAQVIDRFLDVSPGLLEGFLAITHPRPGTGTERGDVFR